MEVTFRTRQLRRNYEESARAVRKWGYAVARIYITRINELYALRDFREAYEVKSLKLHPLKEPRKRELSISLTGNWRLIVEKGANDQHVIVKEVSNHYGD